MSRRPVVAGTLVGFGTGVVFPVLGLAIVGHGVAGSHRLQPVLYVVDAAPVVMAVAGALIGSRHARLRRMADAAETLADSAGVRLAAANDRLERLLDAKSDFVGTLAEELRVPISVIHALVDTMSVGDRGVGPDEMVGLLHGELTQLERLVDDLLVASRDDEDVLSLVPEQFELAGAIDRLYSGFRHRLDGCVRLELERVPVFADAHRVVQVARNLILNADRHGGPNIRLTTFLDGDWAVLEVCDDGVGIPAHDLERIFDPYSRGSTEHSKGSSIGLGLAVARKLVERMNGSLSYFRREGWSVFEVRLPLSPLAAVAGVERSGGSEPAAQPVAPSKPSWRHAS